MRGASGLGGLDFVEGFGGGNAAVMGAGDVVMLGLGAVLLGLVMMRLMGVQGGGVAVGVVAAMMGEGGSL